MPNKIPSVGSESTIQPQLSTTTKLYYITKIYTKPLLTSRFQRRHKIKLELFKQTLSYIIKPNLLGGANYAQRVISKMKIYDIFEYTMYNNCKIS